MAEEEAAAAGASEGAVATEAPGTEAPETATPELEAGSPSGLALVHHAPEHTHPSPAKYVGIAILLAVITAVEVALYYITMPEWLVVTFLMVLAFMKFVLVGAFFMHLKFDSPMLRRLFITGIILAGVVYFVALLTLRVLI
ncbi:MAG TPA: cytochrome C oxidase subunit IV family protein [Acidimicrobiia bacterium]|nr:cytochrome C oxidase subunit IV family protein [Acidimicrobiia bacterium]